MKKWHYGYLCGRLYVYSEDMLDMRIVLKERVWSVLSINTVSNFSRRCDIFHIYLGGKAETFCKL